VVHGDIKPPNVLIFPAPKEGVIIAKICDFGSSEVIDEPDPARGLTRAWTPSWAAPERNHRSVPTAAHDVYSFGLVAAYIAICGTVQYPIELIDQSNASTTLLLKKIKAYFSEHQYRIDDYADALVYRLENVIKNCLLRLPGARMKSLEHVRLDLQGNPGNHASSNGHKLRLQETVVPFQKSICGFVSSAAASRSE
jgi:serine/threonine protein kinase